MNRILIVDDDALSRDKLRSIIDYEKNGYIIAGEAKSGRDAISFIKKEETDIVITDIDMQNVNGIELIEYIRDNYPRISVIALSAYDDYNYVREGLKLGAKDYLLKHRLTSEAYLKILGEVSKTKCQADDNHEEYFSHRKEFLRGLFLEGQNGIEHISDKMSKYKLCQDSSIICVTFFYKLPESVLVNERTRSKAFLSQKIDNIIEGVLSTSPKVELVRLDDDEGLLLFNVGDAVSTKNVQQEIDQYLQVIQRKAALLLNADMFFGVSGIFFGWTRFSDAYSEASENMKMKFFYPKTHVFKAVQTRDNTPIQLKKDKKLSLLNCIVQGDLSEYYSQMDSIFTEIRKRNSLYSCVQLFCHQLLKALEEILYKNGMETEPLYEVNELPFTKKELDSNLDEIKNWFYGMGEKTIKLLRRNQLSTSYSFATKSALLYIQKHFHENISLRDAAKHINFNASYLSRVFKEDTKISFIHYLNRYRINWALGMIKTAEKASKTLTIIAKEAGFNGYNQFLENFKQEVGCTPESYWKCMREENRL